MNKLFAVVLSAIVLSSTAHAAMRDEVPVLSNEERSKIIFSNFFAFSNAQLDDLYTKLDSGAQPDGDYRVKIIGQEPTNRSKPQASVPYYGTSLYELNTTEWTERTFDGAKQTATSELFLRKHHSPVTCDHDNFDNNRMSWSIDATGMMAGTFKHKIREEARMIYPGVYLARSYIKSTFAFYTLLVADSVAFGQKDAPNDWENICYE